jgi:hypothetical protein
LPTTVALLSSAALRALLRGSHAARRPPRDPPTTRLLLTATFSYPFAIRHFEICDKKPKTKGAMY